MKNLLEIDNNGSLQMAFSTDDGTNSFHINGTEIPAADWQGTGNYTYTVNGITYTIGKAPDSTGNYQLIQDSDYNFHFQRLLSKVDELLDKIYPVGCYYDTSDSSFDPNVSFYGTWEQVTNATVLMASGTDSNGTSYAAGDSGGSPNAIVVSHSHTPYPGDSWNFVGSHGSLQGGDMSGPSGSGRHYVYQETRSDGSYWTSNNSTGTSGSSGTGKNMQPYVVVNRWHRTA